MAYISPMGTKVYVEDDGSVSITLPGQEYHGNGKEIKGVAGLSLEFPIDGVISAHIRINNLFEQMELSHLFPIIIENTRNMDLFKSLLAVIHRDGGQYIERYGIEKAYDDAISKITQLRIKGE